MSTQQSAGFRPLNDGGQNIVIGLTKGINGFQELKEQICKDTLSANEHISEQLQHHREELADTDFRK